MLTGALAPDQTRGPLHYGFVACLGTAVLQSNFESFTAYKALVQITSFKPEIDTV